MTEEIIDEGVNNYKTSTNFSKAEKIALRYSELMDQKPDEIDDEFYQELGNYYTSEEIVELGAYIGFNIGFHRFFGTLNFYPMFDPNGSLVSQEESRQIYGDKPISHLKALGRPSGENKDAD